MKKLIAASGIAAVLIAAGAAWLHAATPTVGTLNATPAYIVVNTSTPVLFTVQITDPSVFHDGVNLLRIDGNGKTIGTIGVMRDDGLNGDAVAGDKVLSYVATLNESSAGALDYRASAAFRGVVKRIITSIVTVTALAVDVTANGTVTSEGGIVTDAEGRLALEVRPGAVSGSVRFDVKSISPGKLATYGVDTALFDDQIAGAVDVEPIPHLLAGPPGPTPDFSITVTVPLNSQLQAGTPLNVLTQTQGGIGWLTIPVDAIAATDGLTATFSTNRIGLFLLTQKTH
ncbi:MAG: hypothetical protein JWM11_4408 [Planctomycetaceae bacterium]|nr:hypothetical protein [Planctomycetaceae bacterium]